MITVVTLPDCEKCKKIIKQLKQDKMEFKEISFADCTAIQKRHLTRNSRTKEGWAEFPIITEEI